MLDSTSPLDVDGSGHLVSDPSTSTPCNTPSSLFNSSAFSLTDNLKVIDGPRKAEILPPPFPPLAVPAPATPIRFLTSIPILLDGEAELSACLESPLSRLRWCWKRWNWCDVWWNNWWVMGTGWWKCGGNLGWNEGVGEWCSWKCSWRGWYSSCCCCCCWWCWKKESGWGWILWWWCFCGCDTSTGGEGKIPSPANCCISETPYPDCILDLRSCDGRFQIQSMQVCKKKW